MCFPFVQLEQMGGFEALNAPHTQCSYPCSGWSQWVVRMFPSMDRAPFWQWPSCPQRGASVYGVACGCYTCLLAEVVYWQLFMLAIACLVDQLVSSIGSFDAATCTVSK